MNKASVVLIGCGATGSHAASHIARMQSVARITLVDPGRFERSNLKGQCIDRADVDRPKVNALADKLLRIRPDLEVVAIQDRVENVPRGLLQSSLIATCTDSRTSRQRCSELAWRLGIIMADCGVNGGMNLVRVNTYRPSHDSPCLECGWGEAEYAVLETEYTCGADREISRPTMASSALAGLAASLLAIEIGKILSGDLGGSLASRQLIFDARSHQLHVTTGRRNSQCRFDHRICDAAEPWHCTLEATTVGDALNALGRIRVDGHCWSSGDLVCPGCGRRQDGLRLNRPAARCAECDRRMVSESFGSFSFLDGALAQGSTDLTLAQVGLRAGDMITSGDDGHHMRPRILEAA
jgi:molybdopterin/thiamine biosynthesis adenylyltransferase